MLEATNPVIICYSGVKKLMAVIKDEEEFSRGKKWESKTYIFPCEKNTEAVIGVENKVACDTINSSPWARNSGGGNSILPTQHRFP